MLAGLQRKYFNDGCEFSHNAPTSNVPFFILSDQFHVTLPLGVAEISMVGVGHLSNPPPKTPAGTLVFSIGSGPSLLQCSVGVNGSPKHTTNLKQPTPPGLKPDWLFALGEDNQIVRLKNRDILAIRSNTITKNVSPLPEWWNFNGLQSPGTRTALVMYRSTDGGATWGNEPFSLLDSANVSFLDPVSLKTIPTGGPAFPQDLPRVACPAGGNGIHNPTSSGNYSLRVNRVSGNEQGSWFECRNCAKVFLQEVVKGQEVNGVCYIDGNGSHPHERNKAAPQNSEFFITSETTGNSDEQKGWRFCANCKTLFYSGHGNGFCAANPGNPHVISGSEYILKIGPASPSELSHFTWCSKCQSLLYGGDVLYLGGWDRPEAYADPFTGAIYVSVSSAGGSVNYSVQSDHKALIFVSRDFGKSWGTGGLGYTRPLQVQPPWSPIAMTSNRTHLFAYNPDIYDAAKKWLYPTIYCSTDQGETMVKYHVLVSGVAFPYQFSFVPPQAELGNGNAEWSLSRTVRGVRIAFPSKLTEDSTKQTIKVVYFSNKAKQPTQHLITEITPEPASDGIWYATFIEADRVDLSAQDDTDVAVLYWLESIGNRLKARYCVFYGENGVSSTRDLSDFSWPIAPIGDYMRGGFFYDGRLNFVPQWYQGTASIHYKVITILPHTQPAA